MTLQVLVTCAPGKKAAIVAVEDPCPMDQKMVTKTIQLLEQSDFSMTGLSASEASQIWGIAFSTVIFCYLTAKGVGVLLSLMR